MHISIFIEDLNIYIFTLLLDEWDHKKLKQLNLPVFVYNDWYLEKLILTKEYIQISESFDFQQSFFLFL